MDHKEYENHWKHQGEILEDSFYNPQAEKKIDYLCHTLQQPTSKNDHNNEENYIVCRNHSERQLDSLSNKFCVAKNQLLEVAGCYEDHQADHIF